MKDDSVEHLMLNSFSEKKPAIITNFSLYGTDLTKVQEFSLADWDGLGTQALEEFVPVYKFLNEEAFIALLPKLLLHAIERPGFLLAQNLVGEFFSDLTCFDVNFDGSNKRRLSSLSERQVSCLHLWLDYVSIRWVETDKKKRRPKIDSEISRGHNNLNSVCNI